ncbi:tRNA-uridine aminocarboxypropyltransferase [Desulfosporosinus sp. PR]|uniref:tRNA-uridine aminocarboxypropyltransferase n=1 Tax=Candidatus Desulfosporosinus nitrosoreducens TaxID=3401928 RepID=UPI0027EC03C4|nr:tRNA-uridine aminocarboxypropyltransferase [Desulfosporosinus sp. PR]MDQ7096783.1 tRNA-uridine aminocarboxypropyltransferase [Desulfosporosinus sp. PR]
MNKTCEAFKVKQITRLYESCPQCGLPTLTCICELISPLNTQAKFWIITSEREFYRPSSTGRLLKLLNPGSTEIFLWERTSPNLKLIENIRNYQGRTYLLFPALTEDLALRTASKIDAGENAFILIDGTWKEAGRILRKSDYLSELPLVSLETDYLSGFCLRRGGRQGTLCTIETAMEVLKINDEAEQEQGIRQYFNLFLKHYQAGASSHLPKE